MNPHLLVELFSALVALTWRASWLIIVLVTLRVLVRGRVPAQMWFGVWLIVAIRLLLPFSFSTGWSPYNLAGALRPVPAETSQTLTTVVHAPNEPAEAPTGAEASFPSASILPAVAASRLSSTDSAATWSLDEKLAVVWLTGIALLTVARLVGSWSFRRQLRDEVPVTDGRVAAFIEMELKQSGRRARLLAFETGAVDAPALYGLVRTRMLLPPGFSAKLTDDELRHVVCHELGHWRRRDLLAHGLMQAAVALHWFNPLAWIAARLAQVDCELACDEFVLGRELPGGAPAYGATLLKVLGMVRGRRRPTAVVAMLEGRGQLAQRIRRIAGYRATTSGGVIAGLVLVATLAVASITREARAEDKQNSGGPAPGPVSTSRPSVETATIPLAVGSAGTLTLNRNDFSTHGGIFTKNDAGALTLRNVSTFAGMATISAGTLQTGAGAATGSRAGSTVENAAPAQPAASDAQTTAESDRRAEVERKSKAFDDLKSVADAQRKKVDQLARALLEYKEKTQLVSGDQLRDIITETLKALNLEVQRTVAVKSAAELRLSQVKDRQSRGADLMDLPFIANQPLVLRLTQLLAEAKIAVGTVSQKYGEAHPEFITRAATVAATEKELLRAVDSICRQLEADFEAARRDSERAFQVLERAKTESLALDRGALQYDSLVRELRTNEQILQSITARARDVAGAAGRDAAPPEAAPRVSANLSGSTVIGLAADGAISVNGKNVSEVQLFALLQEIHRVDQNVTVLIEADPKTQSAKLAAVMDDCRRSGLNKFSLQVR